MEEDSIKFIHDQYPWASEATMEKLVKYAKTDTVTMAAALKSLGVNYDLASIQNSAKKTAQAIKVSAKTRATTEKVMRELGKDADPLSAVAELMSTGAKGIESVVSSVTQYTNYLPGWGKVISLTVDGLAKGAVAAAGVASVFSYLITQQEKTARTMIDFGLAAAGMEYFDTMREEAARLGMSIEELAGTVQDAGGMLAAMGNKKSLGLHQFAMAAQDIDAGMVDGVGDYGYTIEELTTRLGEESNLLYEMGLLKVDEAWTGKQMAEQFDKSSSMFTALANASGQQRSNLLKMREEALNDVDFRIAMVQQQAYLAETFGEQAAQNVADSQGAMAAVLGFAFGPEGFAKDTEQLAASALKDIHLDDNVANNAQGELANIVALMGGEVQEQYFGMLQKQIRGELSGDEMVMESQKLIKLIANATPREGDDPAVQRMNNIIAMAKTVPEGFTSMTQAQFEQKVKESKVTSEKADTMIDALDSMRVGYRSMVDALSPQYTTGASAIEGFNSVLDISSKAIAAVFGVEYIDPRDKANARVEELTKLKQDAQAKLKRLGELEQRERDGKFIPPASLQLMSDVRQNNDYYQQIANMEIIRPNDVTVRVAVREDDLIRKGTAESKTLGSTEFNGVDYRLLRDSFIGDKFVGTRDRREFMDSLPSVGSEGYTRIRDEVKTFNTVEQHRRELRSEKANTSTTDPTKKKRLDEINAELTSIDIELTRLTQKIAEKMQSGNLEGAN